ncbi:MAG: hypothetical protein P8Q96_05270, partial [Candidatus Thalassarchaeaceae archaeon]|nr:hypothetical protein [Candidatus Thalassarchaeaceae archaeon]MDG1554298.1 hypothetical protein [Candidatus Thalassarchaeaceae archaeon]
QVTAKAAPISFIISFVSIAIFYFPPTFVGAFALFGEYIITEGSKTVKNTVFSVFLRKPVF